VNEWKKLTDDAKKAYTDKFKVCSTSLYPHVKRVAQALSQSLCTLDGIIKCNSQCSYARYKCSTAGTVAAFGKLWEVLGFGFCKSHVNQAVWYSRPVWLMCPHLQNRQDAHEVHELQSFGEAATVSKVFVSILRACALGCLVRARA
jgi:hypothetical protein